MISARTGAADNLGIDGQYLSAARVSLPVLSESKVGAIFTHGDPTGDVSNTVAGADFQFRRSNILNGGTLFSDSAFIGSFNDGGNGHFIANETAFRSQTWNATMRLRDIHENYAPELGFSNRSGIRRYDFNTFRTYRPETGFIRYAEIGGFANFVTDREGRKLDQYIGAFVGGDNFAGDSLWLNYENGFVDVLEPFSIAGEVPVAAGEYRWDQYEIELSATNARMFGGGVEVRWGGLYDGDYLSIENRLSFRPNRFIELAAEYAYSDFNMPAGRLGVHIASLDSVIAFTPTMTIKTEVQYDNISEALTFFSRFSWEPIPEREIFLSFGHTALIDRVDFPQQYMSQNSSLALRLGHTFRM